MYEDDVDFTVLYGDDIMSADEKEKESKDMILYTYISDKVANELFKYYATLSIRPNEIKKRNIENPIQLPLEVYENPDIAKALSPKSCKHLLKLDIKTDIQQIYDEFNPFSKVKEHNENVYLLRKKNKYNNTNREFISYIIKDTRLILGIQID